MAEPTDKAQTASGDRYGRILPVLLAADVCSFIFSLLCTEAALLKHAAIHEHVTIHGMV
jgi:hypothetical protein